MSVTVRIQDIVDAITMQYDERPSFVDLDTGKVRTVASEAFAEMEAGNFAKLPTNHDIHEWKIMEEFAGCMRSEELREDLLDAIQGPGAFRNFKREIKRHEIDDAWFQFRADALRQLAIEWCESRGLAWA